MTLNDLEPYNMCFVIFFGDFGCKRVNCDEMANGDRPRLPANRNCYSLSRVLWALYQISCFIIKTNVYRKFYQKLR